MKRLSALSLVAIALAASGAQAQTFKMEKFDIKGEGGTDYVVVESATGHIFVSRQTHMMIVDATGKVLGDIPNLPRMHGAGIATKAGFGFVTAQGDSNVTMFKLSDFSVVKKIKINTGTLDGIMYDEADDKIILTNHSNAGNGYLVALDPKTGDVVGTVQLEDSGPEGAVADGKGHIFVNNESVVVDASNGKVVAEITNGDRVDALGYDPTEKLIYIPGGAPGNVTIVHQDSPDKYTTVATVNTVAGAKTICVDPKTHTAYLFQPEFGPAPAGAGARARGPMVAAWFIVIKH